MVEIIKNLTYICMYVIYRVGEKVSKEWQKRKRKGVTRNE